MLNNGNNEQAFFGKPARLYGNPRFCGMQNRELVFYFAQMSCRWG